MPSGTAVSPAGRYRSLSQGIAPVFSLSAETYPADSSKVRNYLTARLNRAYGNFLRHLDKNTYASIIGDGWHLSVDPAEQIRSGDKKRLEALREWLAGNMRVIKLPELLIEVDNELKFSRHFMSASQKADHRSDDICAILTTVMAHGCNIGPYTMAQLVRGVSYKRIKSITDWMLNDETQRSALALVVNAISRLDITQYWGKAEPQAAHLLYRQEHGLQGACTVGLPQ
jgi:hypothetical protein